MWTRIRLDLSWSDLWFGIRKTFSSRSVQPAVESLEAWWSEGKEDSLVCLSARSGFDLLLDALQLPPGSEILLSAITIGDMAEIVRQHGLVAVPVDLDEVHFQITPETFRRAVSSRSRVLVISQLFGDVQDIEAVCELAKQKGIIVVEDCAQAWFDATWRGNECADLSLFSFGTIKTATALGGGLCRCSDLSLLKIMRERQRKYPTQQTTGYQLKLLKAGLLKFLTMNGPAGLFSRFSKVLRLDFDSIAGNLTKGFQKQNFFEQIRRQPCFALVSLMHRRLRTYPKDRIEKRKELGNAFSVQCSSLQQQNELRARQRTFWLIPVVCRHPDSLRARLRHAGFDTARTGRLIVVETPAERPETRCPAAAKIIAGLVLLPCYPEFSLAEIRRMGDLVRVELNSDSAGEQ